MYDAAGMEEFDAAQERLEPDSGDGFVDLDGDEAGKIGPSNKG